MQFNQTITNFKLKTTAPIFNDLGVTARVVLSALNPRKRAWDFRFHHSRDTLL